MRSRLLPYRLVVASLFAIVLSGCGGGGGGSPPPVTNHSVTLTWMPNHETGVNSLGGGYHVLISGKPTIDVPFVSGPAAPISTVTTLQTGTYTVTVSAYAALDAQGGLTGSGSVSAPSQSLTVNVP